MEIVILIAEDKALQAEDLVDRLQSFGYNNILGPFASGEEALKACQAVRPSIAILDINLKTNMTGIELASRLNELGNIPVIYLTHQEDQETLNQSLPTYPVAYLNKPYTNNELRLAILNGVKAGKKETVRLPQTQKEFNVLNDRIFVRNGRGKIRIHLDDILWIQSGGGETSTVMTKERFSQNKLPYTVGFNLNKIEERLVFKTTFARCSRFYIVNLKEIERIVDDPDKNKKMLVIAGLDVALGDKYRKEVMDRFHVL